MSEERELLVHALDRLKHINFEDDHLTNDLIQTIQKYLDQPEQEQEQEQEPVAWGVYDPDSDMLISIYGYKERPDKVLKERFEWVKLYTAPPKLKPLSEDKLDVLAEANITDEGIAGYYLGFRDAEKMHDIGGGE